ncbi:MAG: TonB-dependent siderophore receptor [Halioglobus sp.]
MKTSPAFMGATLLVFTSASFAAKNSAASPIEETLVYGSLSRFSALKSDTPIMETARSISIVSEQQILDRGALTLDDTFTYSAGVTGETFGYATRGDWLRVRGLSVPQYQDSLQSLFGNYNNTRPHIFTLEQVEILKGPASVLYGQGSPGGLVNVISKRPRADTSHQINVEYGTYDHSLISADSTGALDSSGNWLYRFVGVYKDADTQIDNVSEKIAVLSPSLSWRPTDATDVTLLLNYTDTQSDTAAQFLPISGTLNPGPNGQYIESDAYLGDPNFNKYDANTLAVTLLASHQLSAVWSMEFTSRYSDAEAEYQQAWPAFIGGDRYVYNSDGSLYENGTVPRSWYRSDADSEQLAVDVRFRANFATNAIDHNVLIGSQYQDVTTGDSGYYAFALGYQYIPGDLHTAGAQDYWINVFDPVYGNTPPEDELNALYAEGPDTTVKDLGLYVSDHMSLGNWSITAGLRWDETQSNTEGSKQEDEEMSVSIGALYQFDNGLAPYASYAESFEPVIGDNGSGQLLKPQRGEQMELGIKYQPESFPALVTLAWFDLEQSNLPDPRNLPGQFEQQSGNASIEGIELEGIAQLGDFEVQLNWSRLKTESADGYRFASVPENQASTWVTWRPQGEWAGLRVGAGIRYVGDTWDGIDELKTPSYTLGDFMLGYRVSKHWDVALNVRNVQDKDFYATCLARGDCFAGDRRTVVGRISYQL